jgi:hypothetical protein
MEVSKHLHRGTSLWFEGSGRPPPDSEELPAVSHGVTPAKINGDLMDAICINDNEALGTCFSCWTSTAGCMTKLNSQTEVAQGGLLEK